jgi:hypothetical protein
MKTLSEPEIKVSSEDASVHVKIPAEYYPLIAGLTTIQRQILFSLCVNMISKDRKTFQQIADELNIEEKTIYLCRQNPKFAAILSYMVTEIIKGSVDIAVGNLMQMTDNVKAQEILLRIAEVYNPTQRILALSGKLPAASTENSTNPRSFLSGIIQKLSGLGYSKGRLIDEISELYDELKENGSI